VRARRECQAEGLAVEFKGGKRACGGWVAGCGCNGGERRVAGSDDDVELLGCEEEVETIGSASGLQVLPGGINFFAFCWRLEGGK
jgi:hypothetical protein